MSLFGKGAERRKQRETERREALSARLGRGAKPASGEPREAAETEKPAAKPARGARKPAEKPARGAREPARAPKPFARKPRAKPHLGKRVGQSLGVAGAAGRRGIDATARRARVAAPGLRRVLGRGLALLRALLVLALRAAALLERGLRFALGHAARAAAAAVALLSRLITPERAVAGVTVAAAVCLIVSQFSDYRGVEVGQTAYAEVESIAPPPRVDVKTTGEAHAYMLIPLATIAALLALAALLTKRWQLGRLVALAGVIGLAVAFLIDLPNGLDEGSAGVGYAGAKATLDDGFYAQVAACGVIVFCGLLLTLNLRRAAEPARRRRSPRRRRPRKRRAPSLARSSP